MKRTTHAGLLLAGTLGLAHGVADGSVGMQLGNLSRTLPLAQVGLLLLVYNLLAFGSQPLLGMLADHVRAPRRFVQGGLLLHVVALVLSRRFPELAVGAAGLGSAAFHVGGGALALCATRGRATGPGLFAAPGVVGLALGGLFATRGLLVVGPALALLVLLMALIAVLRPPVLPYTAAPAEPMLEGHDLVMLLLLAAIAFRSAIWSSFQLVFHGEWEMLLAMAVAAAIGKLAGGVLADQLGIRRWAMLALALSAPLLALGDRQPALLLTGVALLQSATPACIVAVARLLPGRPATAAGLTLGLAIAAGGIPTMVGLAPILAAPPLPALAALSAALAVWWARRVYDAMSSNSTHATSSG